MLHRPLGVELVPLFHDECVCVWGLPMWMRKPLMVAPHGDRYTP